MGKSWLATRMGIVTTKLRQMTLDKLRGVDRLEKELADDARIGALHRVRAPLTFPAITRHRLLAA